ncbi:MAG TPA: hypothetical protein VGC76_09535 [Pyrinomonadaceae bacterium]|jgi:hypothetical protein
MQEFELNEDASEPQKGFWRRQFQTNATGAQKTFDWIFGVIMPVICFAFGPVVFKDGFFGGALFGAFKPFAYILSFGLIMAMMAWLIWGAKLKWLNAFLAGLFLVGGIVSLGVGMILPPSTAVGLIVFIWILGFTPLFAALVYLRGAFRSFHAARPFVEKGVLVNSLALSALLSVVVPSVANAQIKKSLDEMARGDAPTIHAKTQSLKYIAPLVNFDVLLRRYKSANLGNEEKKALAEAYRELTGESVEKKSSLD